MKHFRLASSAISDLDEIWLFIAKNSPTTADRFIDLLFSKVLALAKQPLMGRARDDLRKGVRSFPVGKYIIFYRDLPNFLEIIRIIHSARDIEQMF